MRSLAQHRSSGLILRLMQVEMMEAKVNPLVAQALVAQALVALVALVLVAPEPLAEKGKVRTQLQQESAPR